VLYHGLVADTLEIQEGAHARIETVETFLNADHKWNFVDTTDTTKDKVIWGHVSFLDHPVVVAPKEELWSSSRLELIAQSEEVF
jgi:phenylalanine-4-hydroxylase